MSNSAKIRSKIIDSLVLDLIGPSENLMNQFKLDNKEEEISELREEILDRGPSRWYQTGFLIPSETNTDSKADDTSDDELAGIDGQNLNRSDQASRTNASADDTGESEKGPARKVFFPSSIGVSFLLAESSELEVQITWADYKLISYPKDEETLVEAWQRLPKSSGIKLTKDDIDKGSKGTQKRELLDSNGLFLYWYVQPAPIDQGYPNESKAVSVFLGNKRSFDGQGPDARDLVSAFQVQLNISCNKGFLERKDPNGFNNLSSIADWDQRVNSLHYRNDKEYAVGHNISISTNQDHEVCSQISTEWLPQAIVEKVSPTEIKGVELSMEKLDQLANKGFEFVQEALRPMVISYESWIEEQMNISDLNSIQEETKIKLLDEAKKHQSRIQEGINLLGNEKVCKAFAITNRVMAKAAQQRFGKMLGKDPNQIEAKWRPFQLAFLLMNLVGTNDPMSPDREIIELLFFPTGGGKTEAYLGLAAFTLVLRRLRHKGEISSAGMSVLMRYTLRLLTLDQLGRSATLICALEIERKKDPETLGKWPFEIGLWVGQSGTPNKIGKKGDSDQYTARSRVLKLDGTKNKPIPIDDCPWCGTQLGKSSIKDDRPAKIQGVFKLLPNNDNPEELRVSCRNRSCEFSGDNFLPLVAVDEMLYKRLPAFVISTVDKFAALPWIGSTGKLFGQVSSFREGKGFIGPSDPPSEHAGIPLIEGLDPPDLIIQDELHLISGPLGSISGLYESIIDELSTKQKDKVILRPKIIASTATVKRATQQLRALFARSTNPAVFPAPGPDRKDSFFSKTVPVTDANGRIYVGVSAPGRNLKALMLRVSLAVMATSQKLYKEEEKLLKQLPGADLGDNPVDPYMTLLGYFNTIKELGVTRRLIEEEVTSQLTTYNLRKRFKGDISPRYAKRKIDNIPLELTSRVPTSEVSETKARLALKFSEPRKVDTALATNMISVGLDISRLGLMVILGQPKTTSEYIQASSRVGRDDKRPGLVIVLLNPNRPRDQSYYERFKFWHSTFYKDVEATSVTPYAVRALERSLPSICIAMARHINPELSWAKNAGLDHVISKTAEEVEVRLGDRIKRACPGDKELAINVQAQVRNIFDKWSRLAIEKDNQMQYGKEEGEYPSLLHTPLDPDLEELPPIHREFIANWSLRDVEPTSALIMTRTHELEEYS